MRLDIAREIVNFHPVTSIAKIYILLYPTQKQRIRPVGNLIHQAVFNRIEMQVIEMIVIIQFVAQRMFPKPLLPHAAPMVMPLCLGHRLFNPAQGQPILGKMFFDNAPAFGIIAIAGRHRPIGKPDGRPPFGHHRGKIRPARHVATPIIRHTNPYKLLIYQEYSAITKGTHHVPHKA